MSALKKETSEASNLTPMMRQYIEIKSQYADAIVFYRLGDFYEMFFDDAITASRLLDLTLTARNKNDDNPVPLCGVPYHSAEGYIAKLVESGRKVVVCEQVEDPKLAKGIVKREVTRVITPGTVLETQSLDSSANNFLMTIVKNENSAYQCAVCDITTGQFEYFLLPNAQTLRDEIIRLQIREIIYPEKDRDNDDLKLILSHLEQVYHHGASDLYFDSDYARDLILSHYQLTTLASLDLKEQTQETTVIGALLAYLKESKILTQDLLSQPRLRSLKDHVFLDETTITNLELFRTQHEQRKQGTLLWHLNFCETPMGSRKLASLIRHPLLKVEDINLRLSSVEELIQNQETQENLQLKLKAVSDIERLANRFLLKNANARDAISLQQSLDQLKPILELLSVTSSKLLAQLAKGIQNFDELCGFIHATLKEDAPISTKDGNMIQDGVNAELDELRNIEKSGKSFILDMEKREKEKTGISSLKIRYNNVFGYYIEITNTHKDKAPEHYIRKQTLSNAERYITDELKDYEAKVLGASERIKILENEIFSKVCEKIVSHAFEIKKTAEAIAMLDVLQSFATVARKYHYVRPRITNEIILDLKGARHPILERLHESERFVPNDITLEASGACEMIITGPNMAGKSTLMRMVALIALMGQIGCFVPCDKATVGVCDRIFTRVGAHDHLQRGLSTFMVEMVETAKILREATPRSLILLDEIGRGTSTFDGLSIAWAVAEDLHDRLKARTLFATHYHELCDLAEQRKGIKNVHMAVREWNGQIIFLRKLNSGGTNRSYGVVVASMAGLPQTVIKRAKDVLKLLELKDLSFQSDLNKEHDNQMSLFQQEESAIIKELKAVDVNALTPLDALNLVARLKQSL